MENVENLAAYIRNHGFEARQNEHGELEALSVFTTADGKSGEAWETVASTTSDVRDWLGY